jgi:eukaryotic-like serine/threonine-protein kinase
MLDAGTAVGRYVIQRKLAEGGMAEIYLASAMGAEGFAKEVVIKVVRPFLASDAQFVQMFIAEARLASRLNHANIVQIFDFGKHENTYFLAMEYVRGASLWELRKRCRELGLPFPPTLAAEISAQVARGLHFAHSLSDSGARVGVVHRDVTPHNILLSFDGAVKLTDFGIAKATTSHTAPGMLKGKFAYMSPEQARGDRVDPRTDVFALGIVAWELLTGGRLFDGDSDVAVLRAVQESLIAPPTRLNPDVPPELSDVVMKALSRRPDERYPTAGDLERALATFTLRAAKSVEDTAVGLFLQHLFRQEYEPERTGQLPVDLPPVDPLDTLGSADTRYLARPELRPVGALPYPPAGSAPRQATPAPAPPPAPPTLPQPAAPAAPQAAVQEQPAAPTAEMPGVETGRVPSAPALTRAPGTEQVPTLKPVVASRRFDPLPVAAAGPAAGPATARTSAPRIAPIAVPTLIDPSDAAPVKRHRPAVLVAVAVLAGLGALAGGVTLTVLSRSPSTPSTASTPVAQPAASAEPGATPTPGPPPTATERPAQPPAQGSASAAGSPPVHAPAPAAEPALAPVAEPAAPPRPPDLATGSATTPPPAPPPPRAGPAAEPAVKAEAEPGAHLAPRVAHPGTLKIFVKPPFGFVTVDGGRRLEVAGSRVLSVKPGSHEVELFDNHELSVRRLTVSVESGQTRTVEPE